MKNILKGLLHFIESTILILAGVSIGSIPLGIGLIVAGLIPMAKAVDNFNGNEIKKSIFSVSKKGKIVQNSLANFFRTLYVFSKKDKNEAFKNETLNMFLQIDKCNKKGKVIKYSTVSQTLTLSLLRQLRREGYIENLEYEKVKESRLILEKILLGNLKGFWKKYPMYKITFTLSDKERNKENLQKLLNPEKNIEPKIVLENNNKSVQNDNTIIMVQNPKVVVDNPNMVEDEKIKSEQSDKPITMTQNSSMISEEKVDDLSQTQDDKKTYTKEDLIALREQLIQMKVNDEEQDEIEKVH